MLFAMNHAQHILGSQKAVEQSLRYVPVTRELLFPTVKPLADDLPVIKL